MEHFGILEKWNIEKSKNVFLGIKQNGKWKHGTLWETNGNMENLGKNGNQYDLLE